MFNREEVFFISTIYILRLNDGKIQLVRLYLYHFSRLFICVNQSMNVDTYRIYKPYAECCYRPVLLIDL